MVRHTEMAVLGLNTTKCTSSV